MVRRFATARLRSRTAVESSAGERTGAGSSTGAELTATVGLEVIGGAAVVAAGAPVVPATEAMGRSEDVVDPEQSDTKLIGARILPGLGLSLYWWQGGCRGVGRARRRVGAVVARWRRGRSLEREAARVWRLRLLRESTTNMFIA